MEEWSTTIPEAGTITATASRRRTKEGSAAMAVGTGEIAVAGIMADEGGDGRSRITTSSVVLLLTLILIEHGPNPP